LSTAYKRSRAIAGLVSSAGIVTSLVLFAPPVYVAVFIAIFVLMVLGVRL